MALISRVEANGPDAHIHRTNVQTILLVKKGRVPSKIHRAVEHVRARHLAGTAVYTRVLNLGARK
jgi:hypothetical protein